MDNTTVTLDRKIGDVVWGIRRYRHGTMVMRGTVTEIYFVHRDMRPCYVVHRVCRGEWGRDLFATEEEARAEMARRRRNDKTRNT